MTKEELMKRLEESAVAIYEDEGMYCTNNTLVQFDHFFCYYGERKEDKK